MAGEGVTLCLCEPFTVVAVTTVMTEWLAATTNQLTLFESVLVGDLSQLCLNTGGCAHSVITVDL